MSALIALPAVLIARCVGDDWLRKTESPTVATAFVLLGADGEDALRSHARAGHDDVVRALLRAGVDVDARVAAPDGGTALTAAAHGDHASTVQLLLEHGADPHAACNCHTAYLIADTLGRRDIVEVLAAHDALVLPTADDGCPPLERIREDLRRMR